MTDQTKSLLDDMDDLEQITSYLNGHLDPERLEAVRRRLEEDATFRDLAAPLLLTWSVPTHLQRNPRPEGEWERDWEEFTKRAGFQQEPPAPKPPARGRRSWRYWGKLFGAGLIVYALLATFQKPIVEQREYSLVPYDTGWISLNDGIEVQLSPGAALQADHRRMDSDRHFLLDGGARFRVLPYDSTAPTNFATRLRIDTRAGYVLAGESDFTIRATADTTVVLVHPLAPRPGLPMSLYRVHATTEIGNFFAHLPMRANEGGRLVAGQDPQRIHDPR